MCKFFSLVSDGNGRAYYFDWKLRKQILEGNIKLESADSHTSIADYYGFKGSKEDILNKYEYNPFTKTLQIDQLNTDDDSQDIEKLCRELDFKEIIPIYKWDMKIINPFKDKAITKITKKDLQLLKVWASVGDSVRASVWDSAWASVGDSVRASVWDSVRASVWASAWASAWDSVWASAWASVGDSVRASMRASVWASAWASVRDSVRAYVSQLFNIEQYKYIKHKKAQNPFQSCIDLWNKGLVPSFDGTLWRIHGEGGKILWTGKIKDIK